MQSQEKTSQSTESRTAVLDSLVRSLSASFDSLTLIVEYPQPNPSAAGAGDMTGEGRAVQAAEALSTAFPPFSFSVSPSLPVSRLTLKASHATFTGSTAHSSATTTDSASTSSTSRDHSSVAVSRASSPSRGAVFRSFLRGAAFGADCLLVLALLYHYRHPFLALLKKILRK